MSQRSLSYAELTALVSAMTLSISILHEWAFFHVLGFHLIGFLSLSDFFRIAVGWLPFVVLIWMGTGVVALAAQRNEKVHDGNVRTNKSRRWRIGNYVKISFYEIFASLLLFFGLVNFFFMPHPNYYLVGVSFMAMWTFILRRLRRIEGFWTGVSERAAILIAVIPINVAMVLSFGAGSAQKALRVDHAPYVIELSDGASSHVQVLRSSELGVIVRDPSERLLSFHTWQNVTSLRKDAYLDESSDSIVCGVLGIGCEEFQDASDNRDGVE